MNDQHWWTSTDWTMYYGIILIVIVIVIYKMIKEK
jgi:hypothetical protein